MPLPLRSQIAHEDQWDLSILFPNKDAWKIAFDEIQPHIVPLTKYQGKLSKRESLLEFLLLSTDLERKLDKVSEYASYLAVTDMTVSEYQSMEDSVTLLASELSQSTAFFTPELVACDESYLKTIAEDPAFSDYRLDILEIVRSKAHVLSHPEELLLARAGRLWGDIHDIFGKLSDVDCHFEPISDSAGKNHDVTHGLYGVHMESYDRTLRQNSFFSLYTEYKEHIHTFAQTLFAKMKQHHFFADIRKYPSTLEAALHHKDIDPSVYHTLIATVEAQSDVLHAYFDLRKKRLGYDTLHPWDLRVPLVEAVDIRFSYDEAVQLVVDSVAPFGEEYQSILHHGLTHGWVDKYENKGKRSGAFSGGCHDSYPYILLNFTGTLNDVFTLAHEAGHSMHSYLARQSQPYTMSDYTIFTAEIASTLNERLLNDFLLNQWTGKEREYLLSFEIDSLRGTFFRQTMFAQFELDIHEAVERGEALTVENLNEQYAALHSKYHGSTVENHEFVQYEWSRIPHFYYNYYVFQYATGIACAYRFADMFEQEGEVAIKRYLDLLKSGGNDFPLMQLKKAGIDMNDASVYTPLLERFSWLVEEMRGGRKTTSLPKF